MALPVGTPSETKLSPEELRGKIQDLQHRLIEIDDSQATDHTRATELDPATPAHANDPGAVSRELDTPEPDPKKIELLQKQIEALKLQSEGLEPTFLVTNIQFVRVFCRVRDFL